MSFQAYIRSLEKVTALKDLVRVLTESDDGWTVVVANLSEARRKLEQLSSTLKGKRADTGTLEIFYKAVIKATLLFGSENWVMTPVSGGTLADYNTG